MLFLLNHATGALVIHAEDRNQVLTWSRRQLGRQALLASVVELDQEARVDWVEKSGTGIRGFAAQGCEAKLSFMADSIQGLEGAGNGCTDSMDWYKKAALSSRNAAVH